MLIHRYLSRKYNENCIKFKSDISLITNNIDVNFHAETRQNYEKIYSFGEIENVETRHNSIKTPAFGEVQKYETRHNSIKTPAFGEVQKYETRQNSIKIPIFGEVEKYETRYNSIKTPAFGEVEKYETRHNSIKIPTFSEVEKYKTRHNLTKISTFGEIKNPETRHNYIFYNFAASFNVFDMKLKMNIIGRVEEQEAIARYIESDNPEFMVIYGRRRVGKTFLIRQFFNDKFAFYVTGLANAEMKMQLGNFNTSLRKYGNQPYPLSTKWLDAFEQLIHLLQYLPKKQKKVIFIDEMPWLDTPHSGFVTALEYFWNSWASARADIFLIVCGSSTAWMTNKLIKNHGGLHNRVTRRMYLEPFTLGECEDFYEAKHIVMNRHEITESYMIFGGIPYYMNLMEKNFSLAQNVDMLCFAKKGALREEFSSLYTSLFKRSENHITIVEILAKKTKGMTRDEICKASKLQGGNLTKTLEELELCGFIQSYNTFNKKVKDKLYQLIDFYTLFYLNYIQTNKYGNERFWTTFMGSAKHRAWSGYAFEQVCLAHVKQIKQKLGITGVLTNVASWRSRNSEQGAQIDLIIERKDDVINLCEMKYANTEFVIDKKYEYNLRNKREAFINETKTRKTVHLTMITTYGVKRNEYSGLIQSEVKMNDLFRKE
ncbi:MAG: ATP-binding protein [Prevotellaceae bacterium]|jgi:AAA+ ATPase superfamily predicted ATPase|nr:ATP-binding protein [Prevotellaceae bacterium]